MIPFVPILGEQGLNPQMAFAKFLRREDAAFKAMSALNSNPRGAPGRPG
jgi:hypothetical protein